MLLAGPLRFATTFGECATLRVATLLTLESAQTLLREIRAEELAWSGIDPETVDILFALTNALNLSPTFHIEN
jgi:hypothetical protein